MEKIDIKIRCDSALFANERVMGDNQKLRIVDDDLAGRRLLIRMLSSAGYTCRESTNGIEALELIHQGLFSLLLADFKMPGLDGTQMLKRLRSDPDLAIAQISSHCDDWAWRKRDPLPGIGRDRFCGQADQLRSLCARIETQLRLRSMRMQLQNKMRNRRPGVVTWNAIWPRRD